ncbi:MAG: 4-(cytidine 5'-diphospho)-2-C-methyl-D-erythritol kinase [Gammaproteobacteria bacterium]|nr:4-(cytidine 5'-diphospho)-2-C-methyl-D-erythritol kinase [Gammaproteobacteria bacterium]
MNKSAYYDQLEPSGPWPAPAKLNLFLHITGRRADGMHDLQTVFQFIDYSDELILRHRADGQISRHQGPVGVPVEQDLCVRAAKILQQAFAIEHGVDIELNKCLPMGAGLGGGSSDAATVLVVLNRLWNIELSVDELAILGLKLGADVPVFVRGMAAFAEGVGEKLTPVELPEPWFLVLIPPVNVSTAKIFSDSELTRDSQTIKICDLHANKLGNDCESVVRKHYPLVADAIDWLAQYAPARMTGTGGGIFASFADHASACRVQEKLPWGWQSFVAVARNRSPLYGALADQGL